MTFSFTKLWYTSFHADQIRLGKAFLDDPRINTPRLSVQVRQFEKVQAGPAQMAEGIVGPALQDHRVSI